MPLKMGTSSGDIYLMGKIIKKYIEENNIKYVDEIEDTEHEKIIQNQYDQIIKAYNNDKHANNIRSIS